MAIIIRATNGRAEVTWLEAFEVLEQGLRDQGGLARTTIDFGAHACVFDVPAYSEGAVRALFGELRGAAWQIGEAYAGSATWRVLLMCESCTPDETFEWASRQLSHLDRRETVITVPDAGAIRLRGKPLMGAPLPAPQRNEPPRVFRTDLVRQLRAAEEALAEPQRANTALEALVLEAERRLAEKQTSFREEPEDVKRWRALKGAEDARDHAVAVRELRRVDAGEAERAVRDARARLAALDATTWIHRHPLLGDTADAFPMIKDLLLRRVRTEENWVSAARAGCYAGLAFFVPKLEPRDVAQRFPYRGVATIRSGGSGMDLLLETSRPCTVAEAVQLIGELGGSDVWAAGAFAGLPALELFGDVLDVDAILAPRSTAGEGQEAAA